MLPKRLSIFLLFASLTIAKKRHVSDFEFFTFAQMFPAAVCQVDNMDDPATCKIPTGASPWTVHGLWPDRDDGTYPQFCTRVAFDPTVLTPIEKELEENWPNLLARRPISSLWKHEWTKHGTCAGQVSETDSEIKYFNKSLALHDQYNIFDFLKSQGIFPSSTKKYTASVLKKALRSIFKAEVEIHCLRERKKRLWLLADARVCLSKTFKPINCSKRRSSINVIEKAPTNDDFLPIKAQTNGSGMEEENRVPPFQNCPDRDILYIS